nr:MAG TPA: hypothetical protein [Caudoviricetes sp.]DAS08422.1 MAG TPA: hypothetical protein [Caudoviricetes sp.]
MKRLWHKPLIPSPNIYFIAQTHIPSTRNGRGECVLKFSFTPI